MKIFFAILFLILSLTFYQPYHVLLTLLRRKLLVWSCLEHWTHRQRRPTGSINPFLSFFRVVFNYYPNLGHISKKCIQEVLKDVLILFTSIILILKKLKRDYNAHKVVWHVFKSLLARPEALFLFLASPLSIFWNSTLRWDSRYEILSNF